MQRNRAKIEAELQTKAQETIQQLLDALPEMEAVGLSDLERLTGEMGTVIMQDSLQILGREAARKSQAEVCGSCGGQLYKRGKRRKQIVTLRGEINIEREYYVCKQCGESCFPPG
jgi:hypothetical protein